MKNISDVKFENNKFFLTGTIDFKNVMSIYEKCLGFLNKYSALEFDFSQIKSCNSAGLALIVELIKHGKQHKKAIVVSHLPEELLAIAKTAELDTLINNNAKTKN